MADDENNEPKKKSGILKILGFAFGGLFLVGAGLGAGFFMFGSTQPDPSEEIEQIIERKMVEAEEKKEADEKADEGEAKVAKETPEIDTFMTTFRVSWYFYNKFNEFAEVSAGWFRSLHAIRRYCHGKCRGASISSSFRDTECDK